MRLSKHVFLIIIIALGVIQSNELSAQKRKKNKTGNSELFVPGTAGAKRQGPYVSPVRRVMNLFNFTFEKGTGFFNYSHELNDVLLARTEDPTSLLYIFPIEDATTNNGPFNAFTNWFNGFRPVIINQINDDDIVIRTNSNRVIFQNTGTFSPTTLKLSFSIRKTDKLHFKTTGERRSTDDDFVRVGGGISFGKMTYKTAILRPTFDEPVGNYILPFVETSQSKLFGSISVNTFNYMDFTIFLDVEAGTWKFKAKDFDSDVVIYDPYFSLGLTFEKKISKYFKIHIRPAFEMRNYQLDNEQINIPNKLSMFSLNLGFLIKYPTYPRNKFKSHQVQMEHVFNGRIYRGRSIFRRQNPRTGQNQRKPGITR